MRTNSLPCFYMRFVVLQIPVDDEFLNVRVTDLALAVGILSRVVADVQNITAAAGPVSTELPSLTLGSGSERTTIEGELRCTTIDS